MSHVRSSRARARRDARLNISAQEARVDLVTERLGLQPQFDPANDYRHARLRRRIDRSDIEETQDDLRETEEQLTRRLPPWLLLFGLLFLFGTEYFGSRFLIETLGFDGLERVAYAATLATGVFFLTAVLATAGRLPNDDVARRSPWFYLLLLVYASVVVAIAILRVGEASGETSSPLADWSAALLILVFTVGPAWFAETLIRRLAVVVPLRRQRRRFRRDRRRLLREQRRADREMSRLARAEERWLTKAARMRASYDAEHRAESNRANGRVTRR